MSIDLWVLSTRDRVISPQEFIDAWEARFEEPQPQFDSLGVPPVPPVEESFSVGSVHGLAFSDGIAMAVGVSSNVYMGVDEQDTFEEFPTLYDMTGLLDAWRRAGHYYFISVKGAHPSPAVTRAERVAAALAILVSGPVLVLDSWFSQPRGVYPPEALL